MGSPRIQLSKAGNKPLTLSKAPNEVPQTSLRQWIAAGVRGLSGFGPGGPIGAGIGLAGEGLAQSIEPRESYNFPQMGVQAGLGAIPFGKTGKRAYDILKGGALASAGNLLTNQAEEGLHIPSAEELGSAAISGTIGSLAGAIRLPKRLLSKEKVSIVEPPIKEPIITPEVKIKPGQKFEPNRPTVKLDLRKRPSNPIIMSDDREAGRKIMEQILAESKTSAPKNPITGTPKVLTQTPKGQADSTIISYLNAPKAIAASSDLSAPLRQGIFLIGRKAWWNSWGPMIRSLREGNYNEFNEALISHPKYAQATKNGLMLGDASHIGTAEEQFASRLAESIPGLGKYLIKPSERAYTTFLNNLRMSLYNDLTDKAAKLDAPVNNRMIASYINAATGRGTMGLTVGSKSRTLEKAAPFLNTMFFSPRFIASRIQLLNPISYAKMDPFTRKEALRDLATLTSIAGTALGLAKWNGADVTLDPTSPDFGKIKDGNVRVDMLGGFGQYIRFFAQTAKGLATEEPGPDPKRFIESKLSPTATMIKEMISGKDYFGRETTIPQSVLNNVAPMIARDTYELWKEDPNLVPLAGLSVFGLPTQSYGERTNNRGTPSGLPRIRLKLPKAP